jgi:hypothetical protein
LMGFTVGAKKSAIMQPSEIDGQDTPKWYETSESSMQIKDIDTTNTAAAHANSRIVIISASRQESSSGVCFIRLCVKHL